MRGVIYGRYSSDGQREESVEGQLRECKEYADRHNNIYDGGKTCNQKKNVNTLRLGLLQVYLSRLFYSLLALLCTGICIGIGVTVLVIIWDPIGMILVL